MTPHIGLLERLLAWVLWRYERFVDVEEAKFEVIMHPELLRTVALLRAYYYNRRAGDAE